MGASNTIKLLYRAGITAERAAEPVTVLPETILLITDPEDELYCPGVDDEPSEGLVQSMRNGWIDGSTILCVNRGPKGGEPIPYAVAGRSRRKAAIVVNAERAEQGLPPIRAAIVFVDPAEAYRPMLAENNRQKRKPLFDARRWDHHKRVTAKKLGKITLDESERAAARAEFAEMVKCSESAINRWEAILSAHPDVIAAVEARTISQNEAFRIVTSHAYDAQPSALPRDEQEESGTDGEKPSKHERKAPAFKMRPARLVSGLLAEAKKYQETDDDKLLVDALALLLWISGEDGSDGDGMAEIKKLAKRAGWKSKKVTT